MCEFYPDISLQRAFDNDNLIDRMVVKRDALVSHRMIELMEIFDSESEWRTCEERDAVLLARRDIKRLADDLNRYLAENSAAESRLSLFIDKANDRTVQSRSGHREIRDWVNVVISWRSRFLESLEHSDEWVSKACEATVEENTGERIESVTDQTINEWKRSDYEKLLGRAVRAVEPGDREIVFKLRDQFNLFCNAVVEADWNEDILNLDDSAITDLNSAIVDVRTVFSGSMEESNVTTKTEELLRLHHWCDEFERQISEIRNDLKSYDDADSLSGATVESELPYPWERWSQLIVEDLAEFWPSFEAAQQVWEQLPKSSSGYQLWAQLLNASATAVNKVSPQHAWSDSARKLLKSQPERARTRFQELMRVIIDDEAFPALQPSLAPLYTVDVTRYHPAAGVDRQAPNQIPQNVDVAGPEEPINSSPASDADDKTDHDQDGLRTWLSSCNSWSPRFPAHSG